MRMREANMLVEGDIGFIMWIRFFLVMSHSSPVSFHIQ